MQVAYESVVHFIPGQSRQKIYFRLESFRGTLCLDVRVWVKRTHGYGYKPTKSGVLIPVHKLHHLGYVIERVRQMNQDRK